MKIKRMLTDCYGIVFTTSISQYRESFLRERYLNLFLYKSRKISCLISLLYKYYIPERVIVRKSPRREATVDNHIPLGVSSDYHPLRNVIIMLIYRNFESFAKKVCFCLNS